VFEWFKRYILNVKSKYNFIEISFEGQVQGFLILAEQSKFGNF
jgi:hypothetical protein